jgi:AbrB family looped-hinge helix DNA binding protein
MGAVLWMASERKQDMHTAYVTSKGQLVIPSKLRRKYNIKKGTRVNFVEDNGKIILQPVTREYIREFRGIYKLKPGEKPATQELLEDRAEEKRREEK